MEKVNIFWHRRDLRAHDNTGLYYALSEEMPVLPVFIFDTNILDDLNAKDDARVHFIHNQIVQLDGAYREKGSGLWVFFGTPKEAFKGLSESFTIIGVYTNRDYEPYARERDLEIEKILNDQGASFHSFKDQVIFEAGDITTDQGAPYKIFTPYKNKWLKRVTMQHVESYKSEKLSNLYQGTIHAIPTLQDIGFERSSVDFPPPSIQEDVLREYHEKRNYPSENGTSRLGIHLRFGTMSIRQVVKEAFDKSESWLNELIWREFYMMILAHYPEVVNKSFKPKYDTISWKNDERQFELWCKGKTGYPIVDAGMRELNATGYMHNRVRMIVASFLTKHLLIDWRWGERYFATKLLDYELSSNNGGWQWAAGSGTDAHPYFRVFNPYGQQEKFDKEMKYIRRWIPEYGTADYPEPIVSHKEARVRAIETYKEALT